MQATQTSQTHNSEEFKFEDLLICPPPSEYQRFDSVAALVKEVLNPQRRWEFNRGQHCQVADQVYVLIQSAAGNRLCLPQDQGTRCPGSFIVQVITVRDRRQGHGSRFLHELAQFGCTQLQSAISPSGLALGLHMKRLHGWTNKFGFGDSCFYSPCPQSKGQERTAT